MNKPEHASISSRDKDLFFSTYKKLDVVIDRGDGCFLYTSDGRKILDMFAGLAVNVLGYAHPDISAALDSQTKKYLHLSNLFYQKSQVELAEYILELSGYSRAFFCNSGTEAVEAAIKMVRKHFKDSGRKVLVSFSGSFHGRTLGALSLTAKEKYRASFGPLLDNVVKLPYDSAGALEDGINDNTAAVFIEFIQGEGGVNVSSPGFIRKLAELRERYGFLLVADEIQAGAGRTGKLHSFEHYEIRPDIVVTAKGIGGGLPLGAVLGNEKLAGIFEPGDHGSTFGGNPVACACGLAVMKQLVNGLMDNAGQVGGYLLGQLNGLISRYPEKVKAVRGKGLMIGVELNGDGQKVVNMMLENDVLVNCTNGNVIRLLPPLILSRKEAGIFLEKFGSVMEAV